MSDQNSNEEKIQSLEKKLTESRNGIEYLQCQLNAYKEKLNESLNNDLTLRTNIIYIKNQLSVSERKLKEAYKKISELTDSPICQSPSNGSECEST